MSSLPVRSLFGIIFEKRSSVRFLMGAIGSISFSIAVILCTIGLMDGFELTLKKALAFSNGDIKFTSEDGFFRSDTNFNEKFQFDYIQDYTSVLQIESFAIANDHNKGVLLRGVEKDSFSRITGLNIEDLIDGVFIGYQFQKKYNLKVGDSIVIAFSSSKSKNQGSASYETFRIDGIAKHGIFEKDMRFIYIQKNRLEQILGYKKGTSNIGFIKINNFEHLDEVVKKLKFNFGGEYQFSPFWSEFEVLFDAVEDQKLSINIVLQLIVVVAILNVVGLIFFIMETKAQDFSMLRALGLSRKALHKFWFILLFFLWNFSCVIAYGLIYIFANFVLTLPFLKIPGDVYVLSNLEVILDPFDYTFVFGVSLAWIILIGIYTMRKIDSKSLVSGLRQEFS